MSGDAISLLQLAKRSGIHVFLNNGELQLKVSKGTRIDPQLLQEIKDNKQILTDFLNDNRWKSRKVGLDENELKPFDRNAIQNIPLSFNQESLWFVDKLNGSVAFHIPVILGLKGDLSLDALNFALQTIVNRHEVLRTIVYEKDGQGYQSILPPNKWMVAERDGSAYTDKPDELQNLIEKIANEPFDLSKDHMIRAVLIKLRPDEQVLVVTIHHIASDGVSTSILVNEVVELYSAFLDKRSPALPLLPIQYADFAVWQRSYLKGELLEAKINYWKEKLQDVTPLHLPADFARPPVQSRKGAIANFRIDKEILEKLHALGQQQEATLFMTLLAALKAMLYRYSGQEDICVGTTVAGREQQEVERLIGYFNNNLALRSDVNGNKRFTELLQEVKKTTIEGYDNQEITFDRVVEAVVKERDQSRNPLFQVVLVLQNLPELPELRLGDVQFTRKTVTHTTSKYDLIFTFTESQNGLQGLVQYSTDLYTLSTVERMTEHFKQILSSIVTEPEQQIGLLQMLSIEEEQQLLEEFNNTHADYPDAKTVIDLFEEQVAKSPEATAVIFEDRQLTFSELNERAGKLSNYLRQKGVKEETLVPICIERSLEMLMGILGILKAGAAYVPIDPEYPEERINFMLEDTSASIIISSENTSYKLSTADATIIELDAQWPIINLQPSTVTGINIKPGNLAYVIYTSGSTGKPKGVMVEHKGVVNLALSQADALRLKPAMRSLQFASFGFDASAYEIFNTLLSGGCLVIPAKEELQSPEAFEELVIKNKVEVAVLPPSYQIVVKDALGTIKTIVSAGEPLHEQVGLNIQAKGIRLVNAYGPTENTVCATLTDDPVKDKHVIVIGKPIANNQVYILDKADKLSAIGSIGEICLGGRQVARGYLNRPELTAEKFIPNPFGNNGDKIYRTGDLGRFLADGNIEYLGRLDEQVKIRGFRIELGEIETVLQQCYLVNQAVVLAKEDKEGSKRLIAYIVPNDAFDKEEIVSYLRGKIPEYMVPAVLLEMSSLPLTASGKIDKKALPDPDTVTNEYVAPQSKLEATLAGIWQELLDLETVGIHDNFFELGGDSIITIQVVSRARLAGYELQVGDMFTYQTIAKLAAFIEQQSETSVTGAEQLALTGESGLLPIQQWYFDKEPAEVSHYNQSVLLGINKAIDEFVLRAAVEQVTQHHDALRFRYYQQEGKWHQEYGNAKGELIVVDLQSETNASVKTLITEHAEKYQRSLDIEKGELIKVVLIKTPASEAHDRLFIIVHHLVIDGVSWRILLDDFERLLSALNSNLEVALGNKTSSYRQWYEALKQYGESKNVTDQKAYWQRVGSNKISLPADKEFNGEVKVKDISHYRVLLDAEQTRRLLQEVPKVYHSEINDFLLCALAITICKWSNSEKIIIGLEGHGRESIGDGIDTSRTVGWFTTLYPVLLEIEKGKREDSWIKSIKEQLRQVPDKGLGYGVLKYINKEEALQNTEPWEIVFNYLGQLDNIVRESKWFAGAGESTGAGMSEELLTEKLSVNSVVRAGQLIVNWSYSKNHYNDETIANLATDYITNLQALINHCTELQKTGSSIFTPSDYGLGSDISYNELDRFLNQPYQDKTRRDYIESIYRLTGLQQGMLFHGLYNAVAGTYIEQFACDLISPDINVFKKSWQHVLNKHSILRSAFYYNEFNIPVQCVYRDVQLPLEILDYRHLNPEERAAALKQFEDSDRAKPFEFAEAPLMRVALIRLTDERFHMLWTSHHLLFDGWSLPIMMEGFLSGYETLVAGKEIVSEEEDRYEDYIRHIDRGNREQEETYWRNYMQGVEQSTLLPFIGTTTERTKGAGIYKSIYFQVDAERTEKIQAFGQKHHITINTIMQGVWSSLLHNYTTNDDIVFGVIVAGRPDVLTNVEKRVGLYINTLPLHSNISEDQEILSWLQRMQDEQVASRKYEYTPLHQIQALTGVNGDLFDSLLVFENYPVSKVVGARKWSLQVENVQVNEQTNYPLTIIISSSDQITVQFTYNIGLLSEAYAKEILGHFEYTLQQITEREHGKLYDLEVATSFEKQQLLAGFNDTEATYPKDKSITDLFEAQVQKTPGKTAVVFEGEELTYQQLNERANQLARYLQSKGVKEETLVPICIERSVEMILGILAILKAGGAYVPIDPEYPEERISYMVEDTAASIVVSSKASKSRLPSTQALEVIDIDTDWETISKQTGTSLSNKIAPHQLAYVIYTSGSTGKPKGVLIEHRNVVRLFETDKPLFDFNEHDVWTMFHSFCFDFSVWEMYGALFYGGRLVIVPGEVTKDASLFADLLQKEKVTVLNQTPSAFYVLQDQVVNKFNEIAVRYVIFGGEALNPSRLQTWKQRYSHSRLINMYGITETTVHVTFQEIGLEQIQSTGSIIGKPIPTLSAYILDANKRLVPVGVAGELYIAGAGLARGYLNRPELSAERFIHNPFDKEGTSRLYKTGDLGRWLPDGSIEYLGRIDEQVKIRGYRIELGEIETVLLQSGLVEQAVITAKQDANGNKRLIGYVVADGEFEKQAMINYLHSKLPDYMVPALWVQLESLPLTSNRKIDKKKLPEPDATELLGNEYVAPATEIQQQLAAIWQKLLGIERVGIEDNFFEVGGHSLLAMRAISAIRKELNVELAIKDLFVKPTISELSAYIETQSKGSSLPAIVAQSRPERIPLSYSQERLWFIDKLEGSTQYHIPLVLRLKGQLNKEALNKALQHIVNRHEVLRTVFRESEGLAYQSVTDKDNWNLLTIDGSRYRDNKQSLQEYVQHLISQPFDFTKDYMLRAALITLNATEHVLVVTMHHIASDAWSMPIFVKEVVKLYKAYEENEAIQLAPLPIQYADYAIWQRTYLDGDILNKKLDYWKEKLQDVAPLQLPADFARPPVWTAKGAITGFDIDSDLSTNLLHLSQQQGATLFITLLAAFKVLLHRYSGQKDICVGTPIANRTQHEIEQLIGFFVNTLAFRSEVDSNLSFVDFLKQVKATTLDGLQHQEVPFEKVVDAVVTERDMSRSPLFQVAFALQNIAEVGQLNFGKVQLSGEAFAHNSAKFDITFYLKETPNGLQGSVEYATDLYREETIQRMIAHYKQLLLSVSEDAHQKVASLQMLTKTEEHRLLFDLNKTRTEYHTGKSIVDLLEEQVLKTPGTIAVEFEEQRLSYSELNTKANQLARYLRNKGVKEETLVPICIDRSIEMIVAILGVMKAGGAYVPIDPEYPAERISYMLEDTKASLLISSKSISSRVTALHQVDVIALDADQLEISKESADNLEIAVAPDHLAYVIYTSGSTGNPKGAMNEHAGVVNRLLWAQDYFNLTANDSVLQKTTFSFDVSVWELLWPLITGSKLVFAKPEGHKDNTYLKSVIEDKNITLLHFVPSMLGVFLADLELGDCSNLKKVLCSGEALKPAHVALFKEKLPHAGLHNLYGPTEAAIDVTCWTVPLQQEEISLVPIGKPVANTAIYILDENSGLVPMGGIGEIHIGGVQVGRGYLNRPELTAQKFINDPFNKDSGARLYKTGDLGRWLADGNVEYLGRIDDQVKIRGFRIELGEIEATMSQSEGIRNAKVIVNESDSANKKLHAYVEVDESLPLLTNFLSLLQSKKVQNTDINILPNGLPIIGSNQNEVKFLYNEIFKDNSYLKHGIKLNEDSVVLDIGANVGFFTVFLNILSEDITVYSFEPIPEVYNQLQANRNLYNIKGKGFQLALLDKEQEIEFEYYPQMSILSGISADKDKVKEVVRSYVENSEKEGLLTEEIDSLLDVKLESIKVKCQAKTLSQIIAEEKIEKIDLLKVDVENSEHLVISGLQDKDWEKIDSVIIEVHDVDGRLKEMQQLFTGKGFKTHVEKENLLSKDDVLYNIYAHRKDVKKHLSSLGENETLRKSRWIEPAEFVNNVRADIEKKLPAYMVPSQIILLEQFPLTHNGKIDKKALIAIEAADTLTTTYEAPSSSIEKALTEIWQELLGLEQVGIDDNFFELGGDSLITLQVVTRARRVGYILQPKDIFIYQTIRKLSVAALQRSHAVAVAEQGILTGESGLLPIQQWYLHKDQENVSHFNQSLLFGIHKSVTIDTLKLAIEQIVTHHDALRFSYHRQDEKWHQEYGICQGEVVVEDMEFTAHDVLTKLITEKANTYQQSLDIQKGEMIRVVFIKTPQVESANRLLIVIHHLAIDGVSWRILLEDLERLLINNDKQRIDLGIKSSSYRQWYNALEKYGQTRNLLSQKEYWQQVVKNYEPLPSDKDYTAEVKLKDISYYTVRLNTDQTKQLLQEIPQVYHTEINDLLLAALANTVCKWFDTSKIIIGLEGHGREAIAEDLDISRTVGWFTNLYPVLLEAGADRKAADLIKSVKEQLRAVPGKGLGYGVLKYINGEETLQGAEPWDIIFNYLGQLDNVIRQSKWFTSAGEAAGATMSEDYVTEKLAVNCMVSGGELIVNWSFSSKHYNVETVQTLAANYVTSLQTLIDHCLEQRELENVVFTPSDYGLGKHVSYEELDRFLEDDINGKTRKDLIESIYPLTGLQQGMLFHSLYTQGEGAYVEQFTCDLKNAKPDIIRETWAQIVNQHSILRTAFYYDAFNVPVQCVYKYVEVPIEVIDLRHLEEAEQEMAMEEYKGRESRKGFDFKAAPLMRLTLIQLGKDRYRMLWLYHHILLDGWSMPVLMEEFLSSYELLVSGKKVQAQEDDKYEDYIRFIERSDKEQEENYWRSYMNGVEESTLLPFIPTIADRTKGVGEYRSLFLQLDGAKTAKIQIYAQKNRLTVNTIMQGVWSYLLHSYTGSNDVVYGTIVSGRPDTLANVERRVGMYINALPLHSRIEEQQKTAEWLRLMQDQQAALRQYQHTTLTEIQNWTGVQGELFDTLFVFENYPVSKVITSKKWSLGIENVKINEKTNYPLTVIIGSAEQISIGFNYNSTILEEYYVREIRNHFEHVLMQMVENAESKLADMQLLSKKDEDLFREFNKTEQNYPENKTIIDLFEEQVIKTPGRTAVVFEGQSLTYDQLNKRANQLAYLLRQKGVKEETLLPICMERRIEIVVGMLGILKAGAAYVPIDPGYPDERISYMLGDTGAHFVITTNEISGRRHLSKNVEFIDLGKQVSDLNKQSAENLCLSIKPENLAYVIYTSGSTGTPKGVMIEHKGVVNLINWHNQEYKVIDTSRATAMAGVGFDAFGWEVWPYLSAGAALYIVDDSTRLSASGLTELFVSNQITHSFVSTALVPAFIEETGDKLEFLQYLLTGGDKLASIDTNNLRYSLVNNYGPTENSVVTTNYWLTEKGKNIIPPIGKPIANTFVYIVNKHLQLTPIGVAGEICIGGAGLARGYLKRPDLTAEKFVRDPFKEAVGARVYKTGDLGRWLPDGNLEYLGRIDDQVKIMGYRIELGEIESVLLQSSLLTNVVVVAKGDNNGNQRLVGYVVAGEGFYKEAVTDYLHTRLPNYMVPAIWIKLDRFPLTQNGKIDRKALPQPDASELSENNYVAPRNELEEKLVQKWQELLGVEQVGVEDNFFEIGGNSLLAMRMVSYIERNLLISIPINVLFQFTTISEISKYLEIQTEHTSKGKNTVVFELLDV